EKLQLRVNAKQGASRWSRRTEIADEPLPGADLDMTHAAGGAVHEHRTDRRGEWIRHRESFESVIADELLSSVSCEFSLRTGFDHAGGEQRFVDVMPAPRARLRV